MKRIIIFILLISALLIPISANSAEPPLLNVIVTLPPDDLKLFIEYYDGTQTVTVELYKSETYGEAYFTLFRHEINGYENAVLIIQSNEKSFTIPIDKSYLLSYDTTITLDFKNETISDGHSLTRSIILVSLRVGLTLIIEGLILFAFGYRKKSSWIMFLILNILTQGFLNMMLSNSLLSVYVILSYVFLEFIVYFIEMIACMCLLKEHGMPRAIFYSLAANTASLILGGILIICLPI